MKFHILTLFPQMVTQGLNTSILGRAAENGLIDVNAVDIRAYTENKHGKVDDYPYGGGAGMLMQAQPVYAAWQAVTAGKKLRTIYVTPQGSPFQQKKARELAKEEELVFLCGHYEGIDERVLEEIVTDYISIGDYVLTGGELAAMVMIDAVARLVPGVLHNDVSAQTESFHNDLLEYPQYSRPKEWHGKKVPEVLLSGNHSMIARWRTERAKERTEKIRPDLYEKYVRKEQLIKLLSKKKRDCIHMMESLLAGRSDIIYANGRDIVLFDAECSVTLLFADKEENAEKLLGAIPGETVYAVAPQGKLVFDLTEKMGFHVMAECVQSCYTSREPLPVPYKEIRSLTMEDAAYAEAHCNVCGGAYLRERILAGRMYGAYDGEKLLGFIGEHKAGGMGMLFVDETDKNKRLGESLLAYAVNRQKEQGLVPYMHTWVTKQWEQELLKELGFYFSDTRLVWLQKRAVTLYE